MAPENSVLIMDVGGGVTQYFVQNSIEPPYCRDLPRVWDEAVVSLTLSVLRTRRKLLRRGVVAEDVELFLAPEVGELDNQEIDAVVSCIPELKRYFDFILIDLPAATNPYYYRFLDATDVEVVVIVPERSFWEVILRTVEVRAPRVIVVMNKYNSKAESHVESWDVVTKFFNKKYPGYRITKIPYDPVLKLVGMHGVEAILTKTKLEEDTAKALNDLLALLEEEK